MKPVFIGAISCQTETLVGSLSMPQSLSGQVSHEFQLIGSLATAYSFSGDRYSGEYEITPTVEGLDLDTKYKYLTEDVKILAIPYFEVSNQSGGNTVYIADEIER